MAWTSRKRTSECFGTALVLVAFLVSATAQSINPPESYPESVTVPSLSDIRWFSEPETPWSFAPEGADGTLSRIRQDFSEPNPFRFVGGGQSLQLEANGHLRYRVKDSILMGAAIQGDASPRGVGLWLQWQLSR